MGQWSNLPVIITLTNSNFVVVRQALFNKVAAQMPVSLKDNLFSTYATFSGNLEFITPLYAHLRVRTLG